jgi:hypothetical protein
MFHTATADSRFPPPPTHTHTQDRGVDRLMLRSVTLTEQGKVVDVHAMYVYGVQLHSFLI